MSEDFKRSYCKYVNGVYRSTTVICVSDYGSDMVEIKE